MHEYQIVQGPSTAIAKVVNNMIAQGWECQGGIDVTLNTDNPRERKVLTYYQAMIKKNKIVGN